MQYDLNKTIRGVENKVSMPQHIFLKRAQLCDNYYCEGMKENTNHNWFHYGLPDVIIIRKLDGWELTFPYKALISVYYSYLRRDQYLMAIIKCFPKAPNHLEYTYSLDNIPLPNFI